jgi:integrase
MQASDPSVKKLLDSARESAKLGAYSECLASLQRALEVAAKQNLSGDKAIVEDNLGVYYIAQGRLEEAKAQWRNSLSDGIAASNLVLQADVLVALSGLLQASGQLDQALTGTAEALDLARRSKNLYLQSRALGELGRLQLLLGKTAEARGSIEEAIQIDRSNRYEPEAAHLLYLAWFYGSESNSDKAINNVLRYFGGKIRISEITPESVFQFQQERLEEGARKATVNRDVATISSLMSRARKMRLISHNPCSDVGKLNERRERRQAKPLSYQEEASLKQSSPFWLSVLITLLVETGLRVRKEALPLKWSDLFLDGEPAYIHVRDSKSDAGLRTVWLTNHCREALTNWRAAMGPDHSPYVFPSPRIPGEHIVDYKTAWQKAAAAAGLKDRRIYDLRSTFASRANSCQVSGLTLAHLLGHASTQILPTYVKPLDENTKAVIQSLDAARTANGLPQDSFGKRIVTAQIQ